MNGSSQDGAIVLGWLTKLVVTLALLGFLAYDGISIVTANFSAADRANTLASEAADEMKVSHDINKVYASIRAQAEESGDTLDAKDFQVASNGDVTLKLRRQANSLWMGRIGPLKKFLDITATGTGAPAS